MKKYVVFTFADYYPDGGMNDMEGDYDTLQEARSMARGNENYQVVDMDTWDIIEQG